MPMWTAGLSLEPNGHFRGGDARPRAISQCSSKIFPVGAHVRLSPPHLPLVITLRKIERENCLRGKGVGEREKNLGEGRWCRV